jgi:hypothetical protein
MGWLLIRFAILGPAAGALGFIVADQALSLANVASSSLGNPGTVDGALAIGGMVLLYSPLIAYPLGLGPAVLAGYFYGRLVRSRDCNPRILARAGLGASIGGLMALPFALAFMPPGSSQAMASVLRWVAAGALGGGAAALWTTAPVFFALTPSQNERSAA